MPYEPTAVLVINPLTVGSPNRIRCGCDLGTTEKGPAIPGPLSYSEHDVPNKQVRVALANVPA